MEQDNDYQIDCVNDLNNTVLGFQPGEDNVYTLTFTSSNIEKKYARIYLVDLVANRITNISESGASYVFESTGTVQKRFEIISRLPDTNSLINSKLHLFCAGNTICVENLTNQKGEFTVYDLVGHCLKKLSFGANEITAIQRDFLVSGAYVFQANISAESVSKVFFLE